MPPSQELQLVQKVELKFALADTDEKFQSTLNVYLAPLLLKFASNDKQVKIQLGKTIKFLLSKFNATSSLKLPVTALLEQVKSPNLKPDQDPTVVQSYTLLFLSKAISRLTETEKTTLVPQLFEGISKFKIAISARLFNIICKILGSLSNEELESLSSSLSEIRDPEDESFILQKFYKFMLLHSVSVGSNGMIPNNISQPGLSQEDCSFFCYYAGVIFNSSTLSSYKLNIIKLIEPLNDQKKLLILIAGSADGDSKISSLASTLSKRISIDYENENLINLLIQLFVGNDTISSVRTQLQEKILLILCKSKCACSSPFVDKISDIGLNSSNIRLKQTTVSFIRWYTATNSLDDTSDEKVEKIAHKLKLNLSDISMDKTAPNYIDNRRYQYEALGLLLKKSTNLLNVSYIQFLLDMLNIDDKSLTLTIQDVLIGLTTNISSLSLTQKLKLKDVLLQIFEKSNEFSNDNILAQIRFIAIKYINVVFPFDDAEARICNILAQSKYDKIETIEESKKGLHPYLFQMNRNTTQDITFPSFTTMIKFISKYNNGINLEIALPFSIRCLIMECSKNKNTIIAIDQYWETRIDQAFDTDQNIRDCISEKLSSSKDFDGTTSNENFKSALKNFIDLSFSHISLNNGTSVLSMLKNLITLCPENITNELTKHIDFLLNGQTKSLTIDSFHHIAQLTGIICSTPMLSDAKIEEILRYLLKENLPSSIGFLISRLTLRKRHNIITESYFESVLKLIETNMNSASTNRIKMSLDCISQLSMFGCLGPDLKLSNQIDPFKEKIVLKLKSLVKKSDEYAIYAWCYLSLSYQETESGEFTLFEEVLFETHVTKHPDNLFMSGEGFAILSDGWNSLYMKYKNDLPGSQNGTLNPHRAPFILEKLLSACQKTKPSLRKAACIWLLSLVQYSTDPIIIEKISEIQYAFMRFLSDREEIVQEAASRGLSIAYEKGGSDIQETLIHNLLKSFTDSNKTSKELISGYVDEETQLFDTGVLNTGDGESVSTYKDVLNLASEVGNPSLVYKFMSLAKNSALWSSRKGIAFGLGAILDKEKLEDMLKSNPKLAERLIPKLFRYKYDPSQSISRTMNNIWNSLILNNKTTLDENFASIKKELLSSMGNREWRVREAGTAGLQDLLRQAEFKNYENDLEDIWAMAFRAMDDIKSSVRKEGTSLTRFLANTMVLKMNNSSNESAQISILKQLVPFLLGNNGLLSDSEDVKKFAFDTIMKLVSTSSKSLKPFIAEMVSQLVLLMTSVEPQVINYLTLNADKYNLKVEDIDSQRLGIVGSSPMMEVIEKLMDLLDENNISDFIDKLAVAIKGAIGLPSKVAGSKVIVNLILRHFFIISKYGDQLLKIASGQLKDKNETVARSYAITCGYCIRISSLKKIGSFGRKLTKYYFEKKSDIMNDDKLPLIASVAVESISKFASDKFQSVLSVFVPLSFIGKNDLNKNIALNFNKVWSDSTSSGSNSIKLYFPEIIELIKLHIQTQSFALRQTIASSIIEIINSLDVKINELNPLHLNELYNLLLESLKGRTYEGKEKLLDSLVKLACKSQKFLINDDELYNRVEETVKIEANRKNKAYKKHSVIALGNLLSVYYENDSLYHTYLELIDQMLKSRSSGYDEEEDMDGDIELGDDDSLSNISPETVSWTEKALLNVIHSISNDSSINSEALEYVISKSIDFIDSTPVDMLPTSDSKFKFKQGIMNIITKMIELNNGNILTKERKNEFTKNMYKLWLAAKNKVGQTDNLQNILVGYARLTGLLLKKLDLDTSQKENCLMSLRLLKSENVGSVITIECDKVISLYK